MAEETYFGMDLRQTRWTIIDLPDEFKMGPAGFAEACQWQVRKRNGVLEAASHEAYFRREPDLLNFRVLAGPDRHSPEAFAALDALPNTDEYLSMAPARIERELARYAELGTLGSLVAFLKLLTMTATSSDLGRRLRELYVGSLLGSVPDSSLALIDVRPTISWRYAAARAMLTATLAPETLRVSEGEEFVGFQSGRAILNSMTVGAAPFIIPCLASLSPFVTGILALRARVDVAWLFPEPLVGRTQPAESLTDALRPSTSRFVEPGGTSFRRPVVTRDAIVGAVNWWVRQLNRLLSAATDLSLFTDAERRYLPVRHTALLLSLERLFSDVTDLLTTNSETARLRACYDALDCLEGMRVGLLRGKKRATFKTLTTPSIARDALTRLEALVPSEVGEVLLPPCRAAVAALDGVKDNFFLSGHIDANGLVKVPAAGGTRSVSWDEAIPTYLRIDRNSAHSFLKEIGGPNNLDKLETFIAHDGSLSPTLSGLAFMWLLLLLAEPDNLTVPYLLSLQRDRGRQGAAP